LTASEGKSGDLQLELTNQGKEPIVVKRWEGSAGFDAQIRNAEGKPVLLTGHGKGTRRCQEPFS
jgi:hypothetical protein